MSKVILTKNRRKALDVALSLDDILYETHRRMMEMFRKDVERWNRQKQVVQVSKGNQIMQIIKEHKTPEGIYVEVL